MAKRSFHLELRMPRLLRLVSHGLSELYARARAPWNGELARLSGQAQRFGGGAWRRIAARWPALAELLREGKRVAARYRPEQPAQHAPNAADAPHVNAPLPEATDALIAQLMASSSWQARAGAALSLAHHTGDGVVAALLRALRDSSVEVAVAAVDGLASQPDEAATAGLLGVLQNRDGYFSPVTRVAAISALAPRLGPGDFEPVLAAVRDIDAEVSIAAAALIAERMPSAAGTHLLPVLRDTSGYYLPIVRLAIANALERAGLLHAATALELLDHERDPAVRRVLERASHLTGEVAVSK